uniref:Uncharacterized protein n=1 Tax=Rhodnius prolixus TaxID=13249 RepID=T1I1B6_RHOPR
MIAEIVITRNTLWYETLKNLCTRFDIPFRKLNNNSVIAWEGKLNAIMSKLGIEEMITAQSKARNGIHHKVYPKLTYYPDYFSNRQFGDIELILKARTETLCLNYRPFKPDTSHLCTLCNLNQVEDIVHFVSVYPILTPYRLKYFNKKNLTENDLQLTVFIN